MGKRVDREDTTPTRLSGESPLQKLQWRGSPATEDKQKEPEDRNWDQGGMDTEDKSPGEHEPKSPQGDTTENSTEVCPRAPKRIPSNLEE